MTTRTQLFHAVRVVVAAACLFSTASCGGELLRTGRSPVFLVITSISAGAGGSGATAFLLSDVVTGGSVVNDNVTVNVSVQSKNSAAPTSVLNAVTLTRYRVLFRRADGRNTPGVDVPYGFDGALSSTTIDVGDSRAASFELVRHQAKLEPPLKNMAGFGGLGFISAIAEITIWGRDQNGNEVTATGSIDVHFGDFIDE